MERTVNFYFLHFRFRAEKFFYKNGLMAAEVFEIAIDGFFLDGNSLL